jgi:hypothetical protein
MWFDHEEVCSFCKELTETLIGFLKAISYSVSGIQATLHR